MIKFLAVKIAPVKSPESLKPIWNENSLCSGNFLSKISEQPSKLVISCLLFKDSMHAETCIVLEILPSRYTRKLSYRTLSTTWYRSKYWLAKINCKSLGSNMPKAMFPFRLEQFSFTKRDLVSLTGGIFSIMHVTMRLFSERTVCENIPLYIFEWSNTFNSTMYSIPYTCIIRTYMKGMPQETFSIQTVSS